MRIQPIPLTSNTLRLAPGVTRKMVIEEVQSHTAVGTRRAVKISAQVGNDILVGWASKKWFKVESIYAAKCRLRGKQ